MIGGKNSRVIFFFVGGMAEGKAMVWEIENPALSPISVTHGLCDFGPVT